jgi:hypothetical protein
MARMGYGRILAGSSQINRTVLTGPFRAGFEEGSFRSLSASMDLSFSHGSLFLMEYPVQFIYAET